ncbi:MAG: hypothetical protein F6K22_26235 [Okeania sp. SIO2F4]|nr:hypothetical protein [Okeania sp. SIO2F4]NES05995.1 hypothetical protein [Okeania sp. SIO2F4]
MSQDVNKRGEYVNWGLKWLIDHHKAKELHRSQMVDDLNISPGHSILD